MKKYLTYGFISAYRKMLPLNIIILLGFVLVFVFSNFVYIFMSENRRVQEEVLSNVGTHFSVYTLERGDFIDDGLLCCFEEPVGGDYDIGQLEGFVAADLKTSLLSVETLNSLDDDEALSTWIMDYKPILKYRYRDSNIGFLTMIGYDPVYSPALVGCLLDSNFVEEGRILEEEDRLTGRILVSKEFSGRTGVRLGQRIDFRGSLHEVVGIVSTNIKPESADIYLAKEDLVELLNKNTGENITVEDYNVLLVESNNVSTMDNAMVAMTGHFGDDSTIKAFACFAPAETSLGLSNRLTEVILGTVLGFTLLTTFLTMFISQSARIRESLIIRANGGSSKGAFIVNFSENMLLLTAALIIFLTVFLTGRFEISPFITTSLFCGLTLMVLMTTGYLQVFNVNRLLR